MASIIAPVKWAQRVEELYVTIESPDCPKPDIKVTADKLVFNAENADKKFHNELVFFDEVDPAGVKIQTTGRETILVIAKKDTTKSYWPRLLKDKTKQFWLKTDFARWKDEDDDDDEPIDSNAMGGFDFSQFANLNGGEGGLPDMSDLDFTQMPGGIANPNFAAEADDEEEGEDDKPPALEGQA